MNLAIRGIEGQIAHGDSFHNDRHPDLKADFILANPPFNVSDWGGNRLREDKRWEFGVPPVGNANFAWVQHFLHHLSPRGTAGFVLANGSMSSNQSNEGEIRRNIIEANLVECIVALPGQLFRSTQIPACLWFLSRAPSPGASRHPLPGGEGHYRGEVLFIDARKLGHNDRPHAPGPLAGRHRQGSRTPITPGATDPLTPLSLWERTRVRVPRFTATYPAFARARRLKRSASTGTSSHPAATSARSRSRTIASPSKKR